MPEGVLISAGALGVGAAILHMRAFKRVVLGHSWKGGPPARLVLSLTLLKLVPVILAGLAFVLWGTAATIAALAGYIGGRLAVLTLARRP